MKVLLINYRYFVSGGPERYMFGVKRLLESRGHQTAVFSVQSSRNEDSEWSEFFVPAISGAEEVYFREHTWTPKAVGRALSRTFYSREVEEALDRLLRAFKPDVALVLHYLRKLSPSVLVALRRHGVPIVVRLSDYAMVCPGAHLYRAGMLCEECVGGSLLPALRHRCVQDSLAVSAVEVASRVYHRTRGYFDLVDAYVAPSTHMAATMEAGGIPQDRIRVVPTFVAYRGKPLGMEQRSRVIAYAGRLHEIKGLDVLLEAFGVLLSRLGGSSPIELRLAGAIDSAYGQHLVSRVGTLGLGEVVRFLGDLSTDGVRDLLSGALCSVVPSVCPENLPNALLESLGVGTPVVASDVPSIREAIGESAAGVLATPGDSEALAKSLAEVLQGPVPYDDRVGACARLVQTRFSPEAHIEALLDVFASVRHVGPR